jgi:predicted anti-sigma-YlaC factor YlaD
MDCTGYHELISARLDGEAGEVEGRALDDHLGHCAACRRYDSEASAMHRRLRIAEVPAVPDQTTRILATIAAPRPTFGNDMLRALLAGLGVAKIAAALGVFLAAVSGGAAIHTGTELAAVDLAIGAGLLLAAWRPAKATGLVPVLAVLAVATLVGGVADLAAGRVTLGSEAFHLFDAVGAFLVWRLSLPYADRRRGTPIPA